VMLRQIGYSSVMSSCMAVPAEAGTAAAITSRMLTVREIPPQYAPRPRTTAPNVFSRM
jgi:hypothetical protein